MKQKKCQDVLDREVTVLEVYGGGTDFYVEYQCPDKDDCDWFMVEKAKSRKSSGQSLSDLKHCKVLHD